MPGPPPLILASSLVRASQRGDDRSRVSERGKATRTREPTFPFRSKEILRVAFSFLLFPRISVTVYSPARALLSLEDMDHPSARQAIPVYVSFSLSKSQGKRKD